MPPSFSGTQATGQFKKKKGKKNKNQTTMLSRDSHRAVNFRQTFKYTYVCIVTQFVNVS